MNSLKLLGVAVLVLTGACARPQLARAEPGAPLAQSDAEAEAVLEGDIEVVIEDSAQGSRTRYFLVVGDRRVSLQFKSSPPKVVTGARVRVTGRWETADSLVVSAIETLSPR